MSYASREVRKTASNGDFGRKLDSRVRRFTRKEQALVGLLPADGTPINTKQLVARFYGEEPGEQPFNARQIIIACMSGIIRKTALHDFGFQVRKSARAGPNVISFWREQTDNLT